MGIIRDLGRLAWRLFNTDGVPESGNHEPVKTDILAFVDQVDTEIADLNDKIESSDTGIEDSIAAVAADLDLAEAEIDALQASNATLAIGKPTWALLATVIGTTPGQIGEVPDTDTGTHTDPVVGGVVPNNGRFIWSAAPAGWQRNGNEQGTATALNTAARLADLIADGAAVNLLTVRRARGGEILQGIDNRGRLFMPGMAPTITNPWVVFIWGQSHAQGADGSIPPITVYPVDRWRAFTFPYGTFGLGNFLFNDQITSAVVPLYEHADVIGNPVDARESYISGIAAQFFLYADQRGYVTRPIIFVNVGLGSATVGQLSVGTNPYNNMQDALTKIKKLYGPGTAVLAHIGLQGEANASIPHSDTQYRDAIRSHYDAFDAAQRAITGQTDPILFLGEQIPLRIDMIASPTEQGHGVQLGQLLLHNDTITAAQTRKIYYVGAPHWVPFADALHRPAGGQRSTGAFLGLALARQVFAGTQSLLRMTGATISGATIVVTTNAGSNLALDTTLIPPTPDGKFGFTLEDAGGVAKTVNSVAVSGTTVIITPALAPAVGWKVKYAHDLIGTAARGPGSWGNVRDTAATEVNALLPREILYTWMASDKRTVT